MSDPRARPNGPRAVNVERTPHDSGVVPNIVAAEFAVGSLVAGKYQVERIIGEGGLGVVVAATHIELDQPVAIKYLRGFVASNPVVVDRFMREARLAAKIKSDHVVRVHDVGASPAGSPYMVMEYLEGSDLGRILADGPLRIQEAIDYVLQACEALAEAHALGIVHRDLKPDNLFLARRAAGSSIVKILDFGISKMSLKNQGPGPRPRELTGDTDRLGTPSYMSPEQLKSTANVDARTDIWSIGVVLYELMTAKMPFEADSMPQLCAAILTSPPRPLPTAMPIVPPGLEHVLLKCLEKDPARRYRNIAELAQDLAPFGLEGSRARVDHIARVVRSTGDSIRPPTPPLGVVPGLPMPLSSRVPTVDPDLAGPVSDRARVSVSGSPRSSRATELEAHPHPATGRRGRWTLPVVLAAVAVALLGGAFLVLGRSHAPAPPVQAPPSVAPAEAPAAAVAPALPPASAAPAVEPLPSASAAGGAMTPRSKVRRSIPKAPRTAPDGTDVPSAQKRAIFGERK